MSKKASIDIFRDLVSEYDAAYRSASEEAVLSDAKDLLGLPNNVMESNLDFKTINKEEIKKAFLSDLALYYLHDTSTEDPIVLALITEAVLFQPYLEEARLFRQAFTRVHRKANKRLLQDLEEKLEEEELFHAFNRMQRKENKALLKSIQDPKESSAFRMALRFAAIILLIAIPAGIYRLYFTGSPQNGLRSLSKNDSKKHQNKHGIQIKNGLKGLSKDDSKKQLNKPGNQIKKTQTQSEVTKASPFPNDYFASGWVEIRLPEASERTINLVTKSTSMGFANMETEFEIKIINLQDQLTYLQERDENIQKRIKFLKNKAVPDKNSTLQSLNIASTKIKSMIQQIDLKSETFYMRNHCAQTNCSDGKVVLIYVLKPKDLQQMKVFNYNNLGTNTFYLFSEGKYFSMNKGLGKLIAENDEIIISALDSEN